jgi:hypothetical protein
VTDLRHSGNCRNTRGFPPHPIGRIAYILCIFLRESGRYTVSSRPGVMAMSLFEELVSDASIAMMRQVVVGRGWTHGNKTRA